MNGLGMIRTYGNGPYRVAVIHGGPGAPGYMAPVARELSKHFGVIEPIQTRDTLDGQIEELERQLRSSGDHPFCLIGSSWGAVLALLVAARAPALAKKLVLVGSAVFDAESSRKVKAIRLSRTSNETLIEVRALEAKMIEAISSEEQNQLMARIADLEFDADVYDPLTRDLELLEAQVGVNQGVWRDFVRLRDNGDELKRTLSNVRSDAVVVHGDHDPHVIEGIYPFLQSCLPKVRLEWLKNCGHYPWLERAARDKFYEILIQECR